MSTRISLLPAKKPMELLSGDQNGYKALSVPASGCDVELSSDRSHSLEVPSPAAANTRRRPSGEIAIDRGSVVGGVTTCRRVSGSSTGVARNRIAAVAPSAIAAATARTLTTASNHA